MNEEKQFQLILFETVPKRSVDVTSRNYYSAYMLPVFILFKKKI